MVCDFVCLYCGVSLGCSRRYSHRVCDGCSGRLHASVAKVCARGHHVVVSPNRHFCPDCKQGLRRLSGDELVVVRRDDSVQGVLC